MAPGKNPTAHVGMRNLKNNKLYLQVYDEIKSYIIKNRLKAGDKLPTEMEMCSFLGVSRNVLREAIKSLEITGVVSSKPGVGIIIKEFNTDYLFSSLFYNLADSEKIKAHTLEVRRVLELGFMREAFDNLTQETLQTMGDMVGLMLGMYRKRGNISGGSLGEEFAEADGLFHKALFSNVDNVILSSITDAFWACDRFWAVSVSREHFKLTVYKHKIILDAALQKDYASFEAAMRFHYGTYYKLDDNDPHPLTAALEQRLKIIDEM